MPEALQDKHQSQRMVLGILLLPCLFPSRFQPRHFKNWQLIPCKRPREIGHDVKISRQRRRLQRQFDRCGRSFKRTKFRDTCGMAAARSLACYLRNQGRAAEGALVQMTHRPLVHFIVPVLQMYSRPSPYSYSPTLLPARPFLTARRLTKGENTEETTSHKTETKTDDTA